MRMRMRQAFQCLKTRPHLVKILRQEAAPDSLFGGTLPDDYFPATRTPDYYYFSNYCHDTSDDAMEALFRESHLLFTEILGMPSDPQARFGIGTPETCSQLAASEV